MNRRDFIALVGGATAGGSLAARAQQPDRMRRIGVLMSASADDPDALAWISGFEGGRKPFGF
jgi:putative ABC transport system substrate-binding protein